MSGIPHRGFTSVSISAATPTQRFDFNQHKEAEQLTQERLEELWGQLIDHFKDDDVVHELLADKHVELKNNNLFHILVNNLYFDTLLKPHQVKILAFLRQQTNNEQLQYKLILDGSEKQETVVYQPRDKFEDMSKRNPAMLELRKIFQNIDF